MTNKMSRIEYLHLKPKASQSLIYLFMVLHSSDLLQATLKRFLNCIYVDPSSLAIGK